MGTNVIKSINQFGLNVFCVTAFSRVMRILRFPRKSIDTFVNWKNRYLSDWLWSNFSQTVVSQAKTTDIPDDKYVFVFWLQGEQQAPPIVKACISSIRKCCVGREVVVLDEGNYSQYATLPPSLLTKYKSGGVTHAHFSDVLRFELLREHGGVWIDATCFISQAFPSYVYEHSFFSLNGAYDGGLGWKWTSWFMAAKKGNLLVENMCRFYEAYWKKYDSAVTYLFLDCWVLALYNHIPEIKAEIDSLPICGKCFSIISKWGHIYSEDLMDDITSQYFVNKLTYKAPLPNERVGEHLTIFGKLIEKFK